MGMPYSNDLRLRVSGHGGWRAGAAGCHAVAGQRFVHLQVSHPSLEDGRDSGADAVCTRPPRKLAGHEQAVLTRLGAITTGGGPNEGMDAPPPAINLDTIAGRALLAMPRRSSRRSGCAANAVLLVALRGAQCRRATQNCGNRIPTNSCLCYVNAVPSRRDAE